VGWGGVQCGLPSGPMPRRTLASACLAVSALMVGLLPGFVAPVAGSSCSAWTSETVPPPTIRVFRHATGAIDTVGFKPYTKNVLSREWIGSWTARSLQSGALIVRNYAWYQVLHWRGGVNASGACFDIRDDTWDQVYDPTSPTWSTAAVAVDATWSGLVYRDGHIFPTYYNAGGVNEACGANANGWKAYQWGTQACGLAGLTAAQIVLTYYYPGVTVRGLGGSPSPTPTPSPTATPTPRATPTPTAGPSGSASPHSTATPSAQPVATPVVTPTPAPTARPTASPTPSPAPSALPAPPADQQLPGGGQASVAAAGAPPPPPPQNPKPVVTTKSSKPVPAAAVAGPLAVSGHIATAGDLDTLLAALDSTPMDPRLLMFRERFPGAIQAFVNAVALELTSRPLIAQLPQP
jgi:hypothetical protein